MNQNSVCHGPCFRLCSDIDKKGEQKEFKDNYPYFAIKHTVDYERLEHQWLVYHGYFELILESLGKNTMIAADIILLGIIRVIFFFILITVYCVYSLEWP